MKEENEENTASNKSVKEFINEKRNA